MESINVARNINWFMDIAPPQMIRVEKSQRGSQFETIVEESNLVTLGEVAPSPMITVTKAAFESTLDTIWEETLQYAEYYFAEAADVILRSPVLGLKHNYWKSLSHQFCIASDLQVSFGAPIVDR